MRQRYSYWPVSILPLLIVIALSIMFSILDGRLQEDVYIYCFLGLLVGYALYFNYPTLQWSFRGWLRSFRNPSRDGKAPLEGRKEYLEETKLVDKYLDTTSADYIYEFLGPIRFVSDHLIYRILTPVYAAVFTLLVILLYYYVPPGLEKPEDPLQDLLNVSITVSGLIAYTSAPRFFTLKSKDYPYYLAKAYFGLGGTQAELSVKLRYFVEGFEAYNLFLQRNIKLKIRELQSIYYLLSSDEVTVQQDIIKKLCLTFHQKGQNLDKLEPFRGIKKCCEKITRKKS